MTACRDSILSAITEMGELMSRPPSVFDTDDRLRSLSEADDPLERLSTVIDFELFRPELEAVLARRDRGKGGVDRPMMRS